MSPRISTGLLAAQSDQRLLELVREGHERAFEAVVQRYRRPLLRYCGRMGLSESRAEDALQHALLQAWLALEGGAEVRELRPWLYRIVHNTAVNAMRSVPADHGQLLDAAGVGASAAAESVLERRIAVRDTLTDVAALPQLQREAILLSAVDGRTHEEVASALGVSHGAVRGLLYRARATLRAAAAALTPAPLISWASGTAGRVAPTAARVAQLTGAAGGSDTGGALLKGAAVAGSAVIAAGAVLVPLHASRTHSHRGTVRSAGLATAKAASGDGSRVSTPSAAGPGAGRAGVPSAGAVRPVAAFVRQHPLRAERGGAQVTLRAAPAPAATAPTPVGGGQPALNVAPSRPASGVTGGDPGRSEGAGRGDGGGSAGGSAAGGSGSGSGAEGTHTEGSGGDVPPGGSEGKGDGKEGLDGAEHEAEAARERAESEAEIARERREAEAEAAREREAGGS
ncbi:MAG TPA: RNA polymerase sigma factor [Solirubrobacteraceae bacterium]|nr:RNA polymerase sigma factor [Solirubrobacteraceae bacterium]